jgi:hypothetical protein
MGVDMPARWKVHAPRHRREKLGRIHRLNCEAFGPMRPFEEARTEMSAGA